MRGKKIKSFLVILLIIIVGFSMTGCRESHVLEHTIYTENQEFDLENDEINNDEDNTDQDQDISSLMDQDDSTHERDQKDTQATRGNGNISDAVAKLKYDQNSVQDGQSTGSGGGQGDSSQTNPTGVDNTQGIEGGNNQNIRQIVDANGITVDIPENVATVSATGETAALIEMLGGPGRLKASSESFTGNRWVQAVFAADMGNVQTLWSGRGRDAISDANFQTLLSLKPSVCLINSGDYTFTDAQLATLSSNGIYIVTIPKLNNLENLESTVRLLGDILGDQSANGGTNAPAIASDYCSWAEGIISKVDGKNDSFNYKDIDFSKDRYANRRDETKSSETDAGQYTLFLSAWDYGATFRLYSGIYQTMAGNGAAIAPSGYSTTPLSYYLSEAGVVNTAAVAPDNFDLQHWYINPLKPSTRTLDIEGSSATRSNRYLTKITDPGSSSEIYLGNSRFHALVVANNGIRDALLANAAANQMWTSYPITTSSDGQVTGYGFLEENGQIVTTTIQGAYDVYVLPDGVGSWNYASAEGVLASMWAAMKFNGTFTEDELRNEIAGFYATFYGYNLSGAEIDAIIAGS